MNKKGQVGNGLIGGLIFGIAGLVIGTVIALVIVSTLTGAGLFNSERTTSTVNGEIGYINATGDTLAGASTTGLVSGSFTIVAATNRTDNTAIVVAGNVSVSAAGIVTNASAINWGNTTINYTYQVEGDNYNTVNDLSGNYTAGIDNVSAKLPTVLLVAAIVLILGVLAFLVAIWQKMRLGGSI